MSSDLIAVVVAAALGTATLVLGWRRKLDAPTEEWLPRYGEERAEEQRPAAGHPRRRPSPRERRWAPRIYLLFGLVFATAAILSARERLDHALLAGIWLVGGLVYWLRWSRNADDAEGRAQ